MNRPHWADAALLAAGIALFLLLLTPATTLWDRDEPRFAQAAVEMLASGDYLLPTFNGELRLQKPPLIYWLMTLPLRLFGPTETAVRMWSPIAMAIAALATYSIGYRLWSARVGLVAMPVFALTPLTVIEGVAATADAVLLASLTVSIAIAVAGLHRPLTAWHTCGVGLALGAGVLVKGPAALALPIPILCFTCWITRRHVPAWRRTTVLLAAATAVAVAVFAGWFVAATAASSGDLVGQSLARENLGRFLAPMEGHGTPLVLAPLYYPAVIVIGFLPWVAYLPRVRRRLSLALPTRAPREVLLLAWIGWPLVVFTVAATKLPHYILPVWPALALSVALVLVGESPQGRLPATPRRLMAASVAVLVGLGLGVAPLTERYKPVPHIMAAVERSAVPGPTFAYAFEEPSLVFYGRRRLVSLPSDTALIQWAALPGKAILVAPRSAIAAVERARGSLGLRELAAWPGWNYVKGERLELVAFVRGADR